MLPGEKGGSTVFEISFWDGCRHVVRTGSTVFECVDELVLGAPDVMRRVDEASLEARECFLAEVAAEPLRMSFAEWVKTREEGGAGGVLAICFR